MNVSKGPWCIRIEDLNTLRELATRAEQATPAKATKRVRPTRTDGLAVIHIDGILMREVPQWFARVGLVGSSYSRIAREVRGASLDDGIERIHLLVDSPGGEVAGIDTVLAELDGASTLKLVTSHCTGCCCSAAYWIASQAAKITATRNALVGSIGVYSVIDDSSRAADAAGVTVNVIRSGPLKGAGIDGSPVLPEHLQAEQSIVDAIAAEFFGDVSRGRGRRLGSRDEVFSGRAWTAKNAIQLGLIDSIVNDEEGITV